MAWARAMKVGVTVACCALAACSSRTVNAAESQPTGNTLATGETRWTAIGRAITIGDVDRFEALTQGRLVLIAGRPAQVAGRLTSASIVRELRSCRITQTVEPTARDGGAVLLSCPSTVPGCANSEFAVSGRTANDDPISVEYIGQDPARCAQTERFQF